MWVVRIVVQGYLSMERTMLLSEQEKKRPSFAIEQLQADQKIQTSTRHKQLYTSLGTEDESHVIPHLPSDTSEKKSSSEQEQSFIHFSEEEFEERVLEDAFDLPTFYE